MSTEGLGIRVVVLHALFCVIRNSTSQCKPNARLLETPAFLEARELRKWVNRKQVRLVCDGQWQVSFIALPPPLARIVDGMHELQKHQQVIKIDGDDHDAEQQRKSFLQEVQNMRRLSNPRVVPVYGIITTRPRSLILCFSLWCWWSNE